MAKRHKSTGNYTALFQVIDAYDEDVTMEIEVEVPYTFTPGAPATGPSYASGGDPGYGPEIEWADGDMKFSVIKMGADDEKVEFPAWFRTVISQKIYDTHYDRIIENHEEDEPEYERDYDLGT